MSKAIQPLAHQLAYTASMTELSLYKGEAELPVLRHQTAFGMGFVGLGYTTAAVSALLFINGLIPAWACIVINGVAFGVLREIEHDLIHNLYFKGRRTLQNIVVFLIWPALGNVPSPLYRRKLHLQHHGSSGHEHDLEERLIGNGNGFGPMRWFTMIDAGLSSVFRRRELESIPASSRASSCGASYRSMSSSTPCG